jgi:Protein of unknown function (DUF3313)
MSYLRFMLRARLARSRSGAFAVAGAAITLAAVASLPLAAAKEQPKEWDGLELRPSKNVAALYVRPGASLAGYKHVRLEPLEIHFDKNWDPNASRAGTNRLTKDDYDRIKQGLSEEFVRVTTKELAEGGYDLVTEAGADVLDVTPIIVDLYIAAPDKPYAGRSRTYTADPGRMTLVAELRDSETGQVLARAIDPRRATGTGVFQITTSVSNLAAAAQIIERWGSALRKALDAANASGAKK